MHHVFRRLVIVVVFAFAASAASAQDPAGTSETILIPGLSVVGEVDPTVAYAVSDLISERLSRSNRFSVVSGDDLRQMLDLESQRQLAGCNDDSCVAEIAGSLDADAVLFGRISRLGDVLIVRITFFDARKAVAVDRIVITVEDEGDLPAAIDLEIGRYLGEESAAAKPAANGAGGSFPFLGTGLATIGVATGVGLLTAGASLGALFFVENPRLAGLDTKGLEAVRGFAIVTAVVGGLATVAFAGVGGALVVAGLVE